MSFAAPKRMRGAVLIAYSPTACANNLAPALPARYARPMTVNGAWWWPSFAWA